MRMEYLTEPEDGMPKTHRKPLKDLPESKARICKAINTLSHYWIITKYKVNRPQQAQYLRMVVATMGYRSEENKHSIWTEM